MQIVNEVDPAEGPIYFDYCASSPIEFSVLQILALASDTYYANPSSVHMMGRQISNLINDCKTRISEILNVMPNEVIFTSGATESNNLAINGTIRFHKKHSTTKVHIILSEIEHPSVFNCCKELESEGVEISLLPVDENGIIRISDLKSCIKDNTVLVSIMHVNNETGAIQPIEEIGEYLSSFPEIYFHVDGVQGHGKVPLSLKNVDLYTISAHKIGGPKGIGLLVIKENVKLLPIIYGGNQEFGLRAGTTNVSGVLGMTKAMEVAKLKFEDSRNHLSHLFNYIYSKIERIPELTINTPKGELSAQHIINFSCKGVSSAKLIAILAKQGIIVSSQSACSSRDKKESRVLMSIKNDHSIAVSSIRVSLHHSVTLQQVEHLVSAIEKMVEIVNNNKIYSFLNQKKEFVL